MNSDSIKIEESWKKVLIDEFRKDYMKNLKCFLVNEVKSKKIIYPRGEDIFSALNLTPFDKVKVVVIGQDPYHGPNQAHGLGFSVKPGISPPPSLLNIYKELETDVGFHAPKHGFLEHWARQGVLLINNVLTVSAGSPGSHKNMGWERFTDKIINVLNESKKGIVFLLWGSTAQSKGKIIDRNRHFVLCAPHPSPLSAYRGFFGCKHFSKTNNYLKKMGSVEIDWQLPISVM